MCHSRTLGAWVNLKPLKIGVVSVTARLSGGRPLKIEFVGDKELNRLFML